MDSSVVIALLAVGLPLLVSVLASYISLNNKLTRVESTITQFAQRIDENREDHQKIWEKLDDHEYRITKTEAAEQ